MNILLVKEFIDRLGKLISKVNNKTERGKSNQLRLRFLINNLY